MCMLHLVANDGFFPASAAAPPNHSSLNDPFALLCSVSWMDAGEVVVDVMLLNWRELMVLDAEGLADGLRWNDSFALEG
ncbi:hypothetical protein GUJ93_ZPchr0012g20655 [Zizania palustris]|uniref:Uncharacterized protein n=1 Tax=Zizania palustris TaxID=103762 RepID=A0A8J5WN67_ZIZPA|nr:hypothetical protein GUJ93_ZPchr0012g20655 [Zizania palustris]